MDQVADQPPFRSVVIAGLGLIGGSVALALRERWPSCRVIGVDSRSVQSHALGSGAIDRAADRLADAGAADLIILAAPVAQNLALLEDAARHADPSTIVTDVGGTKRAIVRAAAALPRRVAFVGGHPIGGAEKGGFGFARPDLFRDRPWVFTPAPDAAPEVLEQLFQFVRGLGARPVTLDADEHDRVMAFLSHLPQLTASALMQVVGAGAAADALRLAGKGLIDTTRLASSPPAVWRDICAENADAIGEALDRLIDALTRIRAGLHDAAAIDALFESAAHWRSELMKGRH